jgi:hypothetical protein
MFPAPVAAEPDSASPEGMIVKITLLDLEDRGQPDRHLLMTERDFAVTRACGLVKLELAELYPK